MRIAQRAALAASLGACLLLTACGQKGPLYLPVDPKPVLPAKPAPAAAPTTSIAPAPTPVPPPASSATGTPAQ